MRPIEKKQCERAGRAARTEGVHDGLALGDAVQRRRRLGVGRGVLGGEDEVRVALAVGVPEALVL